MKIAVLMGSPRKKDSYRICQLIERNFSGQSESEFNYLFLKDRRMPRMRPMFSERGGVLSLP